MVKRLFLVLCANVFLLGVGGCGSSSGPDSDDDGTDTSDVDSDGVDTSVDEETDSTDVQDSSQMESCEDDDPCGDNGTCNDSRGIVLCECDAGWAGETCDRCAAGHHDEDGVCVLDQTCLSTSCAGNGTCSIEDGIVVCECDSHYDSQVFCAQCEAGYIERDGACVAVQGCTQPGEGSSDCGGNGSCADDSGEVVCTCDDGWTGDTCTDCAAGYHDEEGTCVPDKVCLFNTCAGNGTCSDTGGLIECTCDAGYTGEFCDTCAANYHDDGSGTCVADDATCEDADPCVNGVCQYSDGVKSCDCNDGWTGDTCTDCAAGYHDNGAGGCDKDRVCLDNTCSGNGTCSDTGGLIACTCNAGYTGEFCDMCDDGYHDDGSGTCVADDATCAQADPCVNGVCQYSDGVKSCACTLGWAGDTCTDCAAGYHDNGAGGCDKDRVCLDNTCSGNGTCSDTGGLIACTCNAGYTGEFCDMCDDGYHADGSGTCVADDATCAQADPCVNGVCQYSDGVKSCDCNLWWTGEFCDTCIAGYQDENGDGSCQPTCETAVAQGLTCANGGSCQVSVTTGMATCQCTGLWTGATCEVCPNSVCEGQCCGAGESCHLSSGVCCAATTTCDDLSSPSECGATGEVDECGAPIDCGSCGDNGYCSGGTCVCQYAYHVKQGEHECTHVCSGTSLFKTYGCCDEGFQYYCSGTTLVEQDCVAEWSLECGYSASLDYHVCGGSNTSPGGVPDACPASLIGTGCPDDRFIGNSSSAEAHGVSLTGNYSNLRICPGTEDWFILEGLGVGDEIDVTISFTNIAGNLSLFLYDVDGETVLDSSTTSDNTETVSLTVPAAGNYYVMVKGNSQGVENTYELETSFRGFCFNDGFSNATWNDARELTSGVAVTGQVCEDDTDWFSIDVTGDITYTLTSFLTFAHSEGDLNLYVYDDSGAVGDNPGVLLAASETTTSNESVLVSDAPLAEGRYYILVTGASFMDEAGYTVSATTGDCLDAYEPNDTSGEAVTVSTTETLSSLMICPEDQDWFVVDEDLFHWQLIDVTVTHDTDGYMDLELYYNDNGTLKLIDRSATGAVGESISFRVGTESADLGDGVVQTTTGQYYIRVVGRTDVTMNGYQLEVSVTGDCGDRFEPNDNDNPGEVTPIPAGTTEESGLYICPDPDGEGPENADWDIFQFENMVAGQVIRFRIDFVHGDGDLVLMAYNIAPHASDPWTGWVAFANDSTSTRNYEEIAYTVPDGGDGDYYFAVQGDSFGVPIPHNIYTLTVEY